MTVRLRTADGLLLEARWDDPDDEAMGTLVFCHPHPLDGGTMNAPLMKKVTASLVASRWRVLRFNFRGVGASQGVWGGGSGEVQDVAAAVELAREGGGWIGVTGWSFGATTSLRWLIENQSGMPWVGIAPGLRSYRGAEVPDPSQVPEGSRLIVIGDRDQFTTVEKAEEYAAAMSARIEVLPGSDHFFYFREERVASVVSDFFAAVL